MSFDKEMKNINKKGGAKIAKRTKVVGINKGGDFLYDSKITINLSELEYAKFKLFSLGSKGDTPNEYQIKAKKYLLILNEYFINEDKLALVEYEGTLDFYAKPRSDTKKANQKYIPDEAKNMSKKRPIIETVIGLQKGVLDLEHTTHRSALNAFTHMLTAMYAYSFYERKPKVSIQTHKALKQYNSLIAA